MTYLGEIRTNWRFLTAAGVGQAAGYSLINYIGNLFTPHLINEFDWSRSSVALIGVAAALGIVTQPFAGRMTDKIGVRRMALIGVITAPLIFFGLSAMTGDISLFFMLCFAQVIVVGGTTSATVYSRLIAQQFSRARGIALAIAASMPAVAGAASVPFLSGYIEANGWRAGYVAVAVAVAIAGLSAILLIPPGPAALRSVGIAGHDPSTNYRTIVRSPAFKLIIVGMILCNLQFSMQTSQLKVILLDSGVDSMTGTIAISLFAISVIVGRLLCGVALDRLPTHLVATIAMGLPSIGLLLLATGLPTPWLVTLAVLLLGLSLGAEGDILAYVVMRFFRLEIYSSVLGLVLGALAFSVAFGAGLLSLTLKLTGSYTPFLIFSAVAVFIGSGLFLLLKRVPAVDGFAIPSTA